MPSQNRQLQLPLDLPFLAPPPAPPDELRAPQPFIKWVGGKRALLPEIKSRIPGDFNAYWEPFVGGGAVFFSIANTAPAQLSDANAELTTTYLAVRNFPHQLIDELEQHHRHHHADENHYYTVRKMTHLQSPISVAARFIYLNKTGYNGLYRVNRKGYFNVAKGSYKNPQICDPPGILAASEALQSAEIHHRDFSRIAPASGDFVYCDPPHDGTYAGYTARGFDDARQTRLRDLALQWHQAGAAVMLSNSDTPLIQSLYQHPAFRIETVSAPRNVSAKGSTRGSVTELLITTC